MKKIKMGRPPLPEGQGRDEMLRLRVKPDDSEELSAMAEASDKSRSEVVRQKVFDRDIWVDTHWTREQIHQKKIRFQFAIGNMSYTGTGELICREHPDGKKCVVIVAFMMVGPNEGISLNFRLSQTAVDAIKAKPNEHPPFEMGALLTDPNPNLPPGAL
jgi:hypothetical protein